MKKQWVHLLCFVALVPGLAMLGLRKPLRITDAFLMGDQRSANYNLVMAFVLQLGLGVFLWMAIYTQCKVPRRGWIIVKAAALAGYLFAIYASAR